MNTPVLPNELERKCGCSSNRNMCLNIYNSLVQPNMADVKRRVENIWPTRGMALLSLSLAFSPVTQSDIGVCELMYVEENGKGVTLQYTSP